MTLPPFSKIYFMAQSSAIKVLPEAVGLASRMFWPSSTPACMHASWGGKSSVIPMPANTSLTLSAIGNSAIFNFFRPDNLDVGMYTVWVYMGFLVP
jgi:hypothetical protein